MNKRPFSVILLALFSIIAAATDIFYMLQFLHLLPFSSGPFKFWKLDFLSALLWGSLAIFYIGLVLPLWFRKPYARPLVVTVAFLNLSLGLAALIGGTALQNLIPSYIINTILFIYGFLPDTQTVFRSDN
jgi:ribose/xylose/arabinose/galactoside ABC-type transport system permease subunit